MASCTSADMIVAAAHMPAGLPAYIAIQAETSHDHFSFAFSEELEESRPGLARRAAESFAYDADDGRDGDNFNDGVDH